jgi:hypothetical protein
MFTSQPQYDPVTGRVTGTTTPINNIISGVGSAIGSRGTGATGSGGSGILGGLTSLFPSLGSGTNSTDVNGGTIYGNGGTSTNIDSGGVYRPSNDFGLAVEPEYDYYNSPEYLASQDTNSLLNSSSADDFDFAGPNYTSNDASDPNYWNQFNFD